MASVAFGSLPFAEQIAFFRGKLNLPTDAWTDILHEMHDHAFVVAGANRLDMVADFRDAIDRAITSGETLEQFRKRFDMIVEKYGWDYVGGRNWRSRVIYETNLRQSYNAGRYAQLQALRSTRPYWRYRHADGEKYPRPLHQAWNGLVLSADDPWWDAHFPANGWGCKCYVEALNGRDLAKLGKDGPDAAPPVDMQHVTIGKNGPTPRTIEVPAGVDPGFGYTPGKSAFEQLVGSALDKAVQLPADLSAAMIEPILEDAAVQQAVDGAYSAFQDQIMAARQSRNLSMVVGALDSELVAALAEQQVVPSTAPIIARDVEVLHALRDSKAAALKPVALTPDELAALPTLLRSPRAVLLDRQDNALLFVVDASDRREAAKIVVAINYMLKTADGKQVTNSFRTATLVDLADLRASVAGGELTLLSGDL